MTNLHQEKTATKRKTTAQKERPAPAFRLKCWIKQELRFFIFVVVFSMIVGAGLADLAS